MSRRLLQSLHHVRALSICSGLGSSSSHAYSNSSFQGVVFQALAGQQNITVAATSTFCSNQSPSRPWTHLQHHAGISSSSCQASASASAVAAENSQDGIVSFPLAQTGEGISECELMQWFVKVCATATRHSVDLGVQSACMHAHLHAFSAQLHGHYATIVRGSNSATAYTKIQSLCLHAVSCTVINAVLCC
jgi:hypothetical protein